MIFNIVVASQEQPSYKVTKIKKLKNYYVVYATKGDTTYKIVSKKEKVKNCNCKIRKNRSYNLKFKILEAFGGSEVDCFRFDKKTVICKEPYIDIYMAQNLKGLFLVE
ncbi:hypothetical protein [Fulvivirga kasyanovii]|uniref:hypothetical protein n=1 Tax=Fulvivirga kasyanovii TaxID=396812 RepID=UPI0031D28D13